MILVFDLDDTLYPERSFVYSGFAAVGAYLERQRGVPAEHAVALMKARLEHGRDHVLDDVLRQLGLDSTRLARRCISVYRLHTPRIRLSPAALRCLERFRRWPRYLVTDGHRLVQRRKIQALGLDHRIDRCYVTHEAGVRFAKPSPYFFERIRRLHGVSASSLVYVGDDPNKDFVGIKPLGYRTVRVLQGRFRDLRLDRRHEAHLAIESLDQLSEALIERLARIPRSRLEAPAPPAA